MSQIDWSKAPEWADRVILGSMSNSEYWACDDRRQAIKSDYTYYDAIHLDEQWLVSEWRPSPAWNGEGLPPAGTVCEVLNAELDNPAWEKCTILFTGKHRIVYASDSCYERVGYVIGLKFRRIRTHEQIASDERAAAVDAMVVATGYPGSSIAKEVSQKLYDAGYRKPE